MHRNHVFVIGNLDYHMGFNVVDLAREDPSIMIGSMALLITSNSYDDKMNSIVCFAKEYGIPVLWIGDVRPPMNRMSNFTMVTDDCNDVWRFLCKQSG